MLTVLYFASVRAAIGKSQERMEKPASVETVGDLLAHLRSLGPEYERGLDAAKTVKCAVNQDFAPLETVLSADDEVAFFPPVTGG